jgi:hypothetical protein
MKTIRSTLAALALAGTALAGTPQTQQVCYSDSTPFTFTNWTGSVTVPKFNPSLGDLVSIQFTLQGDVRGSARAESLDNSATVVTTQFSATISLTRPDNSVIVVSVPLANFVDSFTAFDGTIDFAGTSGVTHSGINASDIQSATSPPPLSDLALFTGAGNITLPVAAQGSSVANGSGNLITQFTTEASASVRVCYTYLPNTPPVLQCPGVQMASVGVPMSFQICASDVDPNDPVTLSVSGLPAGAAMTPPLPASGNPVCSTFTWTPAGDQVGTFNVVFTAVDGHGRSQSCTVQVLAAECHLLVGGGFGSSQQTIFGHLYDTQLSGLRRFWPVTMTDMPSFAVSQLPAVMHLQVVMHNPLVFPQNPSQWSQTMRVIHNPDDTLSTQYFGTRNGIGLRPQIFTVNGQQRVRFPFHIDGM